MVRRECTDCAGTDTGGTLLDARGTKKRATHKLKQNSLAVGGFVLVARFSSCAFSFLFLMFSDPIAVAIWPHRLSRATHWAGGSVANADVPLPHELTAALALRGHMEVSKPRKREDLKNRHCAAAQDKACWCKNA